MVGVRGRVVGGVLEVWWLRWVFVRMVEVWWLRWVFVRMVEVCGEILDSCILDLGILDMVLTAVDVDSFDGEILVVDGGIRGADGGIRGVEVKTGARVVVVDGRWCCCCGDW
jgi:hypothetical protein